MGSTLPSDRDAPYSPPQSSARFATDSAFGERCVVLKGTLFPKLHEAPGGTHGSHFGRAAYIYGVSY